MTDLIKTDLLAALATTVKAKLTTIFDDLAELATITTEAKATAAAILKDRPEAVAFHEAFSDKSLAGTLCTAVCGLRETILDGELFGYLRTIEEAEANRTADYEHAADERARAARSKAYAANVEAIKSAERIDSGLIVAAAFSKKIGRGSSAAIVIYIVGGVTFEVTAYYATKTRELEAPSYETSIGYEAWNVAEGRRVDVITSEMTPEEIGKTADILDKVRAAMRGAIGPVAVPVAA